MNYRFFAQSFHIEDPNSALWQDSKDSFAEDKTSRSVKDYNLIIFIIENVYNSETIYYDASVLAAEELGNVF